MKNSFDFFIIILLAIFANEGAIWIPYPPWPANQKKLSIFLSNPITGELSFTKLLNPAHLLKILWNLNLVAFRILSAPIAISISSGWASCGKLIVSSAGEAKIVSFSHLK